jgi:hypothetical protein
MATTITFTDGTGAATLDNGKSAPFDRFANWTPRPRLHGESAQRQSDKKLTVVRFGTIYPVHFELPYIPSSGSSSKLTIAYRLIEHLIGGGVCTVNTGDAASTSFSNAIVDPDGDPPELRLTDRELMEYTLSLGLLLAAAPVCRYVG